MDILYPVSTVYFIGSITCDLADPLQPRQPRGSLVRCTGPQQRGNRRSPDTICLPTTPSLRNSCACIKIDEEKRMLVITSQNAVSNQVGLGRHVSLTRYVWRSSSRRAWRRRRGTWPLGERPGRTTDRRLPSCASQPFARRRRDTPSRTCLQFSKRLQLGAEKALPCTARVALTKIRVRTERVQVNQIPSSDVRYKKM